MLRNCIASIFENKIADAKKTFPAVLSALKSRQARIALCDELALQHQAGGSSQVIVEHQQFDMIVRLMNAALQAGDHEVCSNFPFHICQFLGKFFPLPFPRILPTVPCKTN